MAQTTIDFYQVKIGEVYWDYDFDRVIVNGEHHVAQDGTLWYDVTRVSDGHHKTMDAKRLWKHKP